jgi:C_GCAxxG_C_C family probable redox protein
MTRKEIEQKTLHYHTSGYCCTEAIIKSITEFFSDESGNAIPKVGSGFCKGIGKTGEDLCGTVAGGVIALGYLSGRMKPDEDPAPVTANAATFRKRFLDKFGSTNCRELLDNFGEQVQMDKCRKMTAEASGIIADILSGK